MRITQQMGVFHQPHSQSLMLSPGPNVKEISMKEVLDTRGRKSPDCLLKIVKRAVHLKPGSVLKALGDCPTFDKDVRAWCDETGRAVLSVESEGQDTKMITIGL
jgi:tRNA 2-thiouridine synthesizing protein A